MDMEHYQADSHKIRKLFSETPMSNQEIAHYVGLSRMSAYNIRVGKSKMSNISFKVASDLTKLYNDYVKEYHLGRDETNDRSNDTSTAD